MEGSRQTAEKKGQTRSVQKKMPRSSPERRFEESFKETGKTRGSGRQVAERRSGDLEMLAFDALETTKTERQEQVAADALGTQTCSDAARSHQAPR